MLTVQKPKVELLQKPPKRINPHVPSVVLNNPKFPHNVGAAMRACSCFGVKELWVTGSRVIDELQTRSRLPREERMKGFSDVSIYQTNYPLDQYNNITPVAIELLNGSESLTTFQHPKNAVYIFGPEDGSVDKGLRNLCHRFVQIPSRHCLNLAASVYVVLYDRILKSGKQFTLQENRGVIEYV